CFVQFVCFACAYSPIGAFFVSSYAHTPCQLLAVSFLILIDFVGVFLSPLLQVVAHILIIFFAVAFSIFLLFYTVVFSLFLNFDCLHSFFPFCFVLRKQKNLFEI